MDPSSVKTDTKTGNQNLWQFPQMKSNSRFLGIFLIGYDRFYAQATAIFVSDNVLPLPSLNYGPLFCL